MFDLPDQKKDFNRATSNLKKKKKPTGPFYWGLTGPDEYYPKYGKLSPLTRDNMGDLGLIFGNGRSNHKTPILRRAPIEVLPGLTSFDEESLDFLREVSANANKELPVSLDEDLFSSTGVHANFDRLRCVAGFVQSPMAAKPVDNGELRRELGLSQGYTPRQFEIARFVWDLVWGHALPSAVNVAKYSQGGCRRYETDTQWKLDYARFKTEPKNYDRFLKAVELDDHLTLANDFEIVYMMYISKRYQVDAVGKVRLAGDLKYALSGGKLGKRTPTDGKVVINDRHVPDFAAQRVRVVDAGPFAINCDLQIAATAHMRALFKRFPKTFHVNTPEQIKEACDGWLVYCSDVSEYDMSMSKDAIDVVFETMLEYYPPGLVMSAERLMHAPYYFKPLEVGGTKSGFIHSPFDMDFSMNAGNRSGHAMTSLVAKVQKVIETLFIFDTIEPLTNDRIIATLRHETPMCMINNGDDEIALFRDEQRYRLFKPLRQDPSAGHYKVEAEVGQGFSGLLLVRPDPEERVYIPSPRLHTPVEKTWIPERSIGGVFREYWFIGMLERMRQLSLSDQGQALWDIHMSAYRRHIEPKIGPLATILTTAQRQANQSFHSLSPIDREVLESPDKLHYLYDEDDVSQFVRDKVTSKIPLEYCEGFLDRYYSGHYV